MSTKRFCDICYNEIVGSYYQIKMTKSNVPDKYYAICNFCHGKIKEFVKSIKPEPVKLTLMERLKGEKK